MVNHVATSDVGPERPERLLDTEADGGDGRGPEEVSPLHQPV